MDFLTAVHSNQVGESILTEGILAQIVSAKLNEKGNYVLEVRALPTQRLSKTGDTVHFAGTSGWSEPIGLTATDPAGNEVELFATVDIRYRNQYKEKKKPTKTLTVDDLKKA